MKRTLSLLMSLVMALSLTACDGNGNSSSSQASSATPESSAVESSASEASSSSEIEASSQAPSSSEVSSEAQAEDTGSGSSVLVVYYSATGNTAQVAQYIANSTGGDLFELEPVDPYTSDDLNWTDDNSRVNQEHENESLRDVELVADTVDNWDQYDTVFIGYPIWWGIAAWPVDGFVEANDFSGKTVIPFCTSSSSGLGESGQLLADMVGTGDWQEGLRFRSSASQEDVQSWIEELGL
ncbi:flavodoxin [Acutalibacter sp. LFL-21]|uniref:flavodoxin n=1 Tax=Acutalibacter sp. LFL-21 TaxID=2983399 RepID=UPI0021D65402|nr:flavodoxin [Acutalibacter sp. LFL-21]MCU7653787.1 flavodoxin [Acutalibacter sp. LFL-21]